MKKAIFFALAAFFLPIALMYGQDPDVLSQAADVVSKPKPFEGIFKPYLEGYFITTAAFIAGVMFFTQAIVSGIDKFTKEVVLNPWIKIGISAVVYLLGIYAGDAYDMGIAESKDYIEIVKSTWFLFFSANGLFAILKQVPVIGDILKTKSKEDVEMAKATKFNNEV